MERLGQPMHPGEITPIQASALRAAGIFSIAYIALLAILTVPKNGFFRGEDGSVLNGPLITGLVAILIIYFILVGIVYGLKAGTIKSSSDVPTIMAKSLEGTTGYIVLVFGNCTVYQHVQLYESGNDHCGQECGCIAGGRIHRDPVNDLLYSPVLCG